MSPEWVETSISSSMDILNHHIFQASNDDDDDDECVCVCVCVCVLKPNDQKVAVLTQSFILILIVCS